MDLYLLLIETIAIGVMTAIILFVLSLIIKPTSTWRILVLGFLTGAIFHFLMEILGGNDKYCKYKIKITQ